MDESTPERKARGGRLPIINGSQRFIAEKEYRRLKQRVVSLHNHIEKKKRENHVILTIKEVDELCANARRYELAKLRRASPEASFFTQQPGSPRIDTLPSIDSFPVKNKFFKYLYGEMNERKKNIIKDAFRGRVL